MYKKLLMAVSSAFILLLFPNKFEASHQSLQQLINESNDGETIQIPNGTYKDTIVIDKPITLIGEETVKFLVKSKNSAITINSDNVVLKNIEIHYDNETKEKAAIHISGSNNKLENIHINTSSSGIKLDHAHQNTLNKITISGKKIFPIRERNHGIDLWEANENIIKHSNISFVEDGIYVENSKHNTFHDNIVTDSRYGYHLMFTTKTELFNNESYENITGMMIMGTSGTKAYNNILKYNQKNVQSLGLLLFDVRDALVEHNDIAHNRIGIFVEDSHNNEIRHNDVRNNFVGLQFKRAEENAIHNNAFSANVVQGQAEQSTNNETNYNYWSNHIGLDMTGDGLSNLIYKVDPFYLHLTNEFPPYRLLFQSPGMVFLEKMLHTPVEQQLVDYTPLMESTLIDDTPSNEQMFSILIISSLLFVSSLYIIYLGVKQS